MSTENHQANFNRNIKDLFFVFKGLPSKKFKGTLHIKKIQSKLMSCIREEPSYAITIMGPGIWACREKISEADEKYFMNKNYNRDLMYLSRKHKFSYEDAVNTVGFMKDSFSKGTADQKNKIHQLLCELLKNYSLYVLSQQK